MNLCTQGFPILSKNLQEKTKIDNVYNDRAQSEYILEADETMVQIAKKQVIIQNLLFIRKYLWNIFHIIAASCANNVIGLGHLYFLPEKKCKTGIIDR